MADENTDYLALDERFDALEKTVGEIRDALSPEKIGEAIAKAQNGETGDESGDDEVTAESVAKTVDEKLEPVTESITKLTGMVEALGRGNSGQPISLHKGSPNGDAEHAGIL